MPDTPTPAEQLRAAAERLFDAARAAKKEMTTGYYWQRSPKTEKAWKLGITDAVANAPGKYAAILTPDTGIAIAALLFQCAAAQRAVQDAADRNWAGSSDTAARDQYIAAHTDDRALAVARALLGGAE